MAMKAFVTSAVLTGMLLTGSGGAYGDVRAAVFWDELPGYDRAFAESLLEVASRAGYDAVLIGAEELTDPDELRPEQYDVVILPKAGVLPVTAMDVIEHYMQAGGNLVALQSPLWQEPMVYANGAWVTRDRHEQEAATIPAMNMLFDFSGSDALEDWHRSYGPSVMEATYSVVDEGPGEGWRAVHARLGDHRRNWDKIFSPVFDASPFPEGHTLTVLSAKGSPDTERLAIEWELRDGSRWIAAIPVTDEWRRYVLRPIDFHYIEGGRGQRRRVFNPAEVRQLSVGLSSARLGHIDGPHEFWFAGIGTEPLTEDNATLLSNEGAPPRDNLYPEYKFFELTESVGLHTQPDQTIMPAMSWPSAASIRSHHPRAGGGGFDKGRTWRWIPLIEAQGSQNAWRGTPAVLMIHGEGEMTGGQWASFTVEDDDWYRQDVTLEGLGALLERMARGVYLLDGGTQFYTVFEDQTVEAGVRVVNLSNTNQDGFTARVRIIDPANGEPVFQQECPVALAAGEMSSVQESWTPSVWPAGGYQVVAELLDGDTVIDSVEHVIYAWAPDETILPITVENGEFIRDGKRWRAHCINYMPTSGIASEDWGYYEYWLGARSYDPKNIQRDLDIIKDMGLNSVSIFLHHDVMFDHNLLDFLRRCEDLDLYVNFAMRHAGRTPKYGWDELEPRIIEMMEHFRLADHNIIFAYDVAWEPNWMLHPDVWRLNRHWEEWVIDRYGSIENAEADWDHPIPRNDNGEATFPSFYQTENEGPWEPMVAAFRRFLDTMLYKYYSAARATIQERDPHTAVSFRMAYAGDPDLGWPGVIAYDFPYLAAAMDILEPEAYNRIGDWERVRTGRFTHEYGRWAGPELPLIWSEVGTTVWDTREGRSTEEKLDFQATYYRDFYRMMIESGAEGVYWWWLAGGFRYGENSDYGVVNPDGTDRPVTQVIRDHAKPYLDGPPTAPIDYWIEFDRDAHVNGIKGIYPEIREEFWQAVADGHTPGLRTAGTGTNSGNCPLVAVGNVPVTGTNPPKYLDGFFDHFSIHNHEGDWVPVGRETTVHVKAGEPVVARLTITNLAEAAWLAEGEGAVVIEIVDGASTEAIALPRGVDRHETITLDDVALMDNAGEERAIMVRMASMERTPFGPVHRITLVPVP